MPGLSMFIDIRGEGGKKKSAFSTALDSVCHSKEYSPKVLFDGDDVVLGFTGYERYPLRVFSRGDIDVVLEGNVYNRSSDESEAELAGLAELLFHDRDAGKRNILTWLFTADGEFVVWMRHRITGEILLFNDLLGRLPLYYLKTGDSFLISREIGIFRDFPARIALDRMGIAQFLVFCFPLGERTLFENVRRLNQGSILSFSPRTRDAAIGRLHELNFEEKRCTGRTLEDNIEEATALFVQACRERVKKSAAAKTVVSLSGGLDSRSVGAGLKQTGMPFECITYMDCAGSARLDVDIARQVADEFGAVWRKVDLPPACGSDAHVLLGTKMGLNYLSMRFIIPFLRMIQTLHGPDFSHFNGNTGMILRDYRAAVRFRGIDEMIRYILSKGGRFSMISLLPYREAARLTGIGEREFLEELGRVLESFPERSFDQKYVHSVFSGYCYNWHYEGIDMQRSLFWSHTPLESTPFFLHVMQCPDEQKEYYRFYREFIIRLSPETRDIHNATWKSAINSKKALLKCALQSQFNRMPPMVKTAMRTLFRHPSGYGPEAGMTSLFREQMRNCPAIGGYLDMKRLSEITEKCSRIEFDTLFTVTSLIELTAAGTSVFDTHGDVAL